LPRISNYTDFDPLEAEPDVDLHYIESGHEVDGLDILILPGSKSTTGDLLFLMRHGFPQAIRSFAGPVIGICGGYQMLGRKVSDPHGIESHIREADGLGLLDVETVMRSHKETHQAEGRLLLAGSLAAPGCSGPLFGYEIHMGRSTLGAEARPFIQLSRRSGGDVAISDGAVSPDGRVFGTYLHGLFDNHSFRTAFLNRVRRTKSLPTATPNCPLPDPYDLLAEHLERNLDMERLFRICGINEPS
jgi:adenosylcobyric acid synthase